MNRLNNPFKLVFAWCLASVTLTLLIALIAGMSTPGGEQWPLIIVAKAIIVIPAGGLILSLASPFLYKAWSIKYWYLAVLSVIIFGIPVFIYFG